MKSSGVIPICLALTLVLATSAAGQHTSHDDPVHHHGDLHGPSGLFEHLHQGDYSDSELAAIHDRMRVIHESIEEFMGLHNHAGPDPDREALHTAAHAAMMRFHEAYESVVGDLEEEHALAFSAMLFEHLLHHMATHGHGAEGHRGTDGKHGHG